MMLWEGVRGVWQLFPTITVAVPVLSGPETLAAAPVALVLHVFYAFMFLKV